MDYPPTRQNGLCAPPPEKTAGGPSGPCTRAVEQFRDELHRTRQAGKVPSASGFLADHPEWKDDPDAVVRVIYEEICYRQEKGEGSDFADLFEQFPEHAARLRLLLECQEFLEPPAPCFPGVGQSLGEFRLLAILGQGACGRVYLATQPNLADRPVVLKVGPIAGQEHLSLARLQHAHIVPLYLAQQFPTDRLQALCMPWLGGTSLNQLLDELEAVPWAERHGRALVEALDRAASAVPIPAPATGPARRRLVQMTYADAICWLVVGLLDGLQYAHDRGLVHLDLKPANILLAADGQPMLLDFHLAQPPFRPGGPEPSWLGGTPPFMAPEQAAALRELAEEKPLTHPVDERADVFGMGMVLYAALGGPLPTAENDRVPHLSSVNAQVSVGLGDVVARCIAPKPADRYPTAAAVADDLRRHLNKLPLVGVANRSWRERWNKWRRRRPQARLVGITLVVAVLAVAAVTLATAASAWRQHQSAHADLADGDACFDRQDYAAAAQAYRRAREYLGPWEEWSGMASTLADRLHTTHRAARLVDLHRLTDRLRLLVGIEDLPVAHRQQLAAQCQKAWDDRLFLLSPTPAPLSPGRERGARADLTDLLIVWADLQLSLAAPAEQLPTRQSAFDRFREAETLAGTSPPLRRAQLLYEAALGRSSVSTTPEPVDSRDGWERAALGRLSLREANWSRAADELDQALRIRPQDFWLNYYRGVGAYHQFDYDIAVRHFHACVTLAPQSAEAWFNRGLAFERLGKEAAAREDFGQALALGPHLTVAALHRGILSYRCGRYAEALADLDRVVGDDAPPAGRFYRGLTSYQLGRYRSAGEDLWYVARYVLAVPMAKE